MRCFVAIELDQPLRAELLRLMREQLPATQDVRWCTERQLHITLKFLGETLESQVSDISSAIAAAADRAPPFNISLAELGCFPNKRGPRVLWCGVTDEARGCAAWLGAAAPPLADLGFPSESREYHPHITLGRSRNASGGNAMSRMLDSPPVPEPRAMLVERVTLFESRLSPQGARYISHFTAPLGGSA